jgi:streptomycin 6-kinase
MITIPEAFAAATIRREGEAGRRWLADLPPLVEQICAQWGLVAEGPVLHGYLALVIPARRADQPCVLKISWRDEATREEEAALTAWAGRGAVRLLASEPSLGALLLERLDHTRRLSAVPIEDATPIAGRLLRRLAIPAPAGLRPLATVAEELAQTLPVRWQQLGRPLAPRLLDQTCDLARQLGPTGQRLLVNYDLHYDDILAGQREPWLAVDPKVVVGDSEYGLAQLLWTRLDEMAAAGGLARHFDRLTEAAELDRSLARAWTLVRCVDYWLWGLSVGLTEDPVRCEFITNWLA